MESELEARIQMATEEPTRAALTPLKGAYSIADIRSTVEGRRLCAKIDSGDEYDAILTPYTKTCPYCPGRALSLGRREYTDVRCMYVCASPREKAVATFARLDGVCRSDGGKHACATCQIHMLTPHCADHAGCGCVVKYHGHTPKGDSEDGIARGNIMHRTDSEFIMQSSVTAFPAVDLEVFIFSVRHCLL